MNEEELKHYNEMNKLLIENCFTGKIPNNKLDNIIYNVQKRQEKILARKGFDEEEEKRTIIYAQTKDVPVRSLVNPMHYSKAC